MPPILDEGVCIRQWDWSETSQTVSLLCRGLGLVRGLAKGAKRPTHPFSGGIELLTRGRVGTIVKHTSDLAILTEWDLQETFPALRRSLDAHYAALYFAELVQHAVHDHDPHERLYDELLLALRSLDTPPRAALAIQRFQWATLVETGYMPVLDRDVITGESLSDANQPREHEWCFFDPAAGGLRIPNSGEVGTDDAQLVKPPTATPHRAWRVRRETIETLRSLAHTFSSRGSEQCSAEPTADAPQSGPSLDRANRLLASYLRHVFGREPKMLPILFGPHLPR